MPTMKRRAAVRRNSRRRTATIPKVRGKGAISNARRKLARGASKISPRLNSEVF